MKSTRGARTAKGEGNGEQGQGGRQHARGAGWIWWIRVGRARLLVRSHVILFRSGRRHGLEGHLCAMQQLVTRSTRIRTTPPHCTPAPPPCSGEAPLRSRPVHVYVRSLAELFLSASAPFSCDRLQVACRLGASTESPGKTGARREWWSRVRGRRYRLDGTGMDGSRPVESRQTLVILL